MSTPFERVLVPVDGSEPAAAALGLGLRLAAQGAVLVLVHASDDPSARAPLDDAVRRCRSASFEPVIEQVRGRPVDAILEVAREEACDLIAMGTHARPAIEQAFVGSTTVGVLRASEIPVLTLRTAVPDESALFGIALVAVDDSEPSDAALAQAARLHAVAGTRLVLCGAVDTLPVLSTSEGLDPTDLIDEMKTAARETIARGLARTSLTVVDNAIEIVEGEAAQAILETAGRRGADLIVMGSHGRRGIRRLFLGSVAEYVVRHSDCPVLVVRR